MDENESQTLVAEVEPMRLIEALHEVVQVLDVAYEQALALAHEKMFPVGSNNSSLAESTRCAVPLSRLQRSLKMPLCSVAGAVTEWICDPAAWRVL